MQIPGEWILQQVLSSRFNPSSKLVVLQDLTQMLLAHGEVLLENVLNLQLMMTRRVDKD